MQPIATTNHEIERPFQRWKFVARLMMCQRFLSPLLVVLATSNSVSTDAAPILGQVDRLPAVSIQDITLLGGTPINPGPELSFPVEADGFIVWDIADENEAAAEIPFVVSESEFLGVNPLGRFILRSGDLAGTMTNIVKSDNSGDRSSFVSADFELSGFFTRDIVDGPAAGITLFTMDETLFTGTVTGLPFPVGTTLISPDPIDAFVSINGEAIKVVVSSNRTVTIVPEPNTLVGLGLIGMLGCGWRWRRKRHNSMCT